jgi:molybdopterin-binding protein
MPQKIRSTEVSVMKYGARNQLDGIITGIKKGDVMGQVNIEIPAASQMGSVMTVDSIEELGLKVSDKVKVVVKAINVLVVKE